MSFALRADRPLDRDVRRLARKQLTKARDALSGQDGGPDDARVHDARKRLKRVRALLRLARPGLGKKRYARENAALRDTARPLSEVRDARALVGALDKLRDRPGVDADALGCVRDWLLGRQDAVRRRVVDEEKGVEGTAAALEDALGRTGGWDLDGGGWAVVGDGLRRIYRAGRKAWQAAREDPTDANLHEWRKQAKYLWHALRLLEPIGAEALGGLIEKAHDLADRLGDDHDLVVLDSLLADEGQGVEGSAALRPVLDARRQELQREAWALGEELYQDKPRAFVDALRPLWRTWRAAKRQTPAGAS
jgi:CHAD domain-containing protein